VSGTGVLILADRTKKEKEFYGLKKKKKKMLREGGKPGRIFRYLWGGEWGGGAKAADNVFVRVVGVARSNKTVKKKTC